MKKPPLRIQPTTLWEYPSQDYGDTHQGRAGYKGATPSYIIWNLLQRYTKPKDLVVDPFAGSGTTLDVARDLDRRALGYDVHPTRKDIFKVDARKLPPELTGKVDFVFMDPPYSTHLDYGPDPRDIGKLDVAKGPQYYDAMSHVFAETMRLLKPGKNMAVYVSDSYVHGLGSTRSASSCSTACAGAASSRSTSSRSCATTRRWRWATTARRRRRGTSSFGDLTTCSSCESRKTRLTRDAANRVY
jgi:DNA modification methylase